MATAEVIRDSSMAVTRNAVPLAGDAIPGSTQEYGVTANSQQSPVPVFFAPQLSPTDLAPYWGSLFSGVVRGIYTHVTTGRASSQFGTSTCSPIAWDRLSLELMRLASLESNWDGEGAETIPQETVTTAAVLLFLARIATEHSIITQCPVPIVIPTAEGGITLKWTCGRKELKCTVLRDIVEVVRWRSPDGYESDGFWAVTVDGVAEHFEWLLQQ